MPSSDPIHQKMAGITMYCCSPAAETTLFGLPDNVAAWRHPTPDQSCLVPRYIAVAFYALVLALYAVLSLGCDLAREARYFASCLWSTPICR